MLLPVLAAVSLSVSDLTTAGVRSVIGGDGAALDLSTNPRAELAFDFRKSRLALDYAPYLGVVDVTSDPQLVLLHGAGISYSQFTRKARFTLRARGSYGTQSFLTAARPVPTGAAQPAADAGATPPADTGGATPPDNAGGGMMPAGGEMMPQQTAQQTYFIPQREVVKTGSLLVGASFAYTLSKHWLAGVGAAYEIAGGLGSSAQYLPLRRGPTGDASLGYIADRRNTLVTSAVFNEITTPDLGGRFLTLSLLETWAHRFSRATVGSISGGVTYLASRYRRGYETDRHVLGAGGLSLTDTQPLTGGATLTLSAQGGLDTGYNQVLGAVTQRAGGQLGVRWNRKRVSLGCTGQVSQGLPVDEPTSALTIGASARATYEVSRTVMLQLGGGWTRQRLPETAVVPGVAPDLWTATVGVLLTPPPLF